ncbi:MAG: hypothetical protein IR153_11050 [Flavobacterium sp.]|nr:hypothetical protein [Flavobacterium sp.]
MENSNDNKNRQPENWQREENIENSQSKTDSFNLTSAEADGYGIDENTADDALYTQGTDDDDTDERDDDENAKTDWGNVDPLSDTDGLPSGVDPSGPGSAV